MLWRSPRKLALCLALAALSVVMGAQPAAAAQTGGASAPDDTPQSRAPKHPAPGSGGTRYHAPDRQRPVLTRFTLSNVNLFALGRPVQIKFAIRDRSRSVRVRLSFVRVGSNSAVYRANLGRLETGKLQTFKWRGTEGGKLTPGSYRVRISARDNAGNTLRGRGLAAKAGTIHFETHRFPVVGPHTFGGDGARFGADRPGHTHAGQDVVAAEGQPVVAPRGGTITWVGYQAAGAGYYVVLDADGEDFDYAFMHFKAGTTRVRKGQHVSTGARLGDVGQTGDASGPHLHFEMWRGTWYGGGKPIDPLPALKAWDAYS